MKKYIILVAVAACSFSILNAQNQLSDFRNFQWGSTAEQIQQNEKSAFSFKDNDNMFVYKDELAGYTCNVTYEFNEDNKLVSGNYIFTKRYTNPQLYEQDYLNFKNLLIRKYGQPVKVKENWDDTHYLASKKTIDGSNNNSTQQLLSKWTTSRSNIEIALDKADNIYTLHIQYTAKSPVELLNQDAVQNALSKL